MNCKTKYNEPKNQIAENKLQSAAQLVKTDSAKTVLPKLPKLSLKLTVDIITRCADPSRKIRCKLETAFKSSPVAGYYAACAAKCSASAQPRASVIAAAVEALIMLPSPGIQPIKNCEAVLPTVAPAIEAIAASAELLVRLIPKTAPNEIAIVN